MSSTDTGDTKAEKVWQLAEAVNAIGCAVVALEEALGLKEKEAEGPAEVPSYSDLPRRLNQLIGWLVDAGHRAEKIVEAVGGLRKTVN